MLRLSSLTHLSVMHVLRFVCRARGNHGLAILNETPPVRGRQMRSTKPNLHRINQCNVMSMSACTVLCMYERDRERLERNGGEKGSERNKNQRA